MAEESLVTGGDRLTKIYGRWPTFHDAQVDRVIIERRGPDVSILLQVNDYPESDEDELLTGTVLRWRRVHDLQIAGIDRDESNWINGLRFERRDALIHTEIEQMDGTHGWILAESVEVARVGPSRRIVPFKQRERGRPVRRISARKL